MSGKHEKYDKTKILHIIVPIFRNVLLFYADIRKRIIITVFIYDPLFYQYKTVYISFVILTKHKHFAKQSKTNAWYNTVTKSKTNTERIFIMNNNDQKFMAQRIRAQYMEKEFTELDELRELDEKVKRPANVFAYTFGSISAIVMGSGMSLVMTDIGQILGIGNTMVAGIIIGLLGMAMAIVNYPIYKKILGSRKNKYGAEILKISDKIMNK